jgi:transposase InsO family protein
MVRKVRKKTGTNRWGGRKLYSIIKQDLQKQSIKMGRDKFFDLLRSEGLLVKPRKRHYFTTQSHHWLRKYDYLIEGMKLTSANQLWVSDITYVESQAEALYLYLITDAYSRMIVGWYISEDLKASSAVKALEMAIKNNPNIPEGLIHHSDRGVQYCSSKYVEILKSHSIKISMTHGASPHQNSIAERVNGIIKEEWLYDLELKSRDQAERKIKEIIKIYNTIRPHQSLNYNIPEQVHRMGFLRNKIESIIIGKQYKRKKKAGFKKNQPSPINASNTQVFLAGCSPAEPASASLRQDKSDK